MNIISDGGEIKNQEAIFERRKAEHCPGENFFFCIINVTEKIKLKLCCCVIQGVSKNSISFVLQVQQVFANQENMLE